MRSGKPGQPSKRRWPAVADLPIPQHLASKEDLVQALGEIKIEIADEFKGLYRFLLVTAVSIIAVIVGILKLFP